MTASVVVEIQHPVRLSQAAPYRRPGWHRGLLPPINNATTDEDFQQIGEQYGIRFVPE